LTRIFHSHGKHDHKTLQNASTSFNIKSQHDVLKQKDTFEVVATFKNKLKKQNKKKDLCNSSFILAQPLSASFHI